MVQTAEQIWDCIKNIKMQQMYLEAYNKQFQTYLLKHDNWKEFIKSIGNLNYSSDCEFDDEDIDELESNNVEIFISLDLSINVINKEKYRNYGDWLCGHYKTKEFESFKDLKDKLIEFFGND